MNFVWEGVFIAAHVAATCIGGLYKIQYFPMAVTHCYSNF